MVDDLETPRGRLTRIGGWALGHTLGRGAYAHVRLATHLVTGHQAACKILPALASPRSWNQTLDAVEAHKEVVLLKAFTGAKIPGVVAIEGVVEEDGWTYVFLSLHRDSLTTAMPTTERDVIVLFRRLLRTFHALHELGVSHEDVKRSNILVEGLHPILADFGFSLFSPDGEMVLSAGGTPLYSSPEKLKGGAYDPCASDVWSLGLLLLKMLRVKHPYFTVGDDQGTRVVEDAIIRDEAGWDWLPDGRARFGELMRGMLAYNPVERWTIAQILDHRYLRTRAADDQPIPIPSRRLSSKIVRPVPQTVVDDLCFLAYLKRSFFLCESRKKVEDQLYNKERTWEKRWATMLHGWEQRVEMEWEDVPTLRVTPGRPSRRRRYLPALKEIRLSPIHKPKWPRTPRKPSPKQSRRRKSQASTPTTPTPLHAATAVQNPATPGPKQMLWPPKSVLQDFDTPVSSVDSLASPLALRDRTLENVNVNTRPRTRAQKAMRALAAGPENKPFTPKKVLGPSAFGRARRPQLGYEKKVTAMRALTT